MRIANPHIARVLFRIANYLELAGGADFKVRAWRRAAEAILASEERIDEMVMRDFEQLSRIPGIGASTGREIAAVVNTGNSALLTTLEGELPPTLLELLRIRGLGPARVRSLWSELQVGTVEDLQRALEDGRLREVTGFTARTEDRIRRSFYEYMAHRGRTLRAVAENVADEVLAYAARCGSVRKVSSAGSYRRGTETVGNLDFVVATDSPDVVEKHFRNYEEARNFKHVSNRVFELNLFAGITARIVLTHPERFGAVLHWHTGSPAHVEELAAVARARELYTAPDGLSRGGVTLDTPDEVAFFEALGLPYIAPELREGRGELEAAHAGTLPTLITIQQIRGDLHMHTTSTDGRNSIEEMAVAARARGYEYIAITDHTRNVRIANGLEVEQVPAYLDQIDAVNRALTGLTVLKGLEVDILPDGTMDMPDEILARLDVVIASIHSHFDQAEPVITARVLRALDHPLVQILAHPSGRLVGQRSPLLLDLDKVLERAAQTGTMLELNSNPERLDLNDRRCREARELGIPVVISTDAHSVQQLENLTRGVRQARRGWMTPDSVLNTRPVDQALELLWAKRRRGNQSQ